MTSGEDHPEVLTTAHLLASLHRQAGDLSAARRVLENALYAGTNRHGEEHPLMLSISFELAEIADELGNRHEARRHYTRVAKYGPVAVNFNQQQVQAARAWLGPSAPAPAQMQSRPVTLPAPEPLQLPKPATPQTAPTQPVTDEDFGLGPAISPPRFGPAAEQPSPPRTTQPVPPQPVPPQPVRPQDEPTLPVPTQQVPPQQPAPTQAAPTVQLPAQTQQPPVQQQQPPARPQQQPPVVPPWPPHGRPATPPPPGPQRTMPPQGVTQQGIPTPRPPQLNPPSTTTHPSSPAALVPRPQSGIPAGRPKRGRGVLIGSLIGALVAVFAASAAVYLVLNNAKIEPNPSPSAERLPAANVAIVVRDDRVTLTWTDPSNGVAQPIVVGSKESEGLRRFAMPAKGSTEAVIPGLNKNFEYCFAIVLVYSEDDLKQSEQVCTDRKKATPSPSR